jgi:predicted double-glycine peptidase
MLVALAAALSLASSLTIDVPYLPQTDALCGGAAAAMVFRYWGDAHADPQQFASLIQRRRGVAGIANDVLVAAIRSRGWRTEALEEGDPSRALDALRARLAARQPVIVLLADRGDQYHYVVITGISDDAVLVHDPSWGPSRAISDERFAALWNAARNWAVVILPGERGAVAAPPPAASPEPATEASVDGCDALVARAVVEVQHRGMSYADEILGALRSRCSRSPAWMRELAGVRFVQQRWAEAEELARTVLNRAPADAYASSVLGGALFMQNQPAAALAAWNRVGEPRLDSVRINGVTRSRYQAVVESLGLRTGTLLTPDAFVRARHRLEDLPDRVSSRLSLRPGEDGFASVDVAIVERSGVPRSVLEWGAAAARAAIEQEVGVTLPGATGQGEIWNASWRWWSGRPRVGVSFAAPRVAGLPGVWRVDGSWEAETYSRESGLSLRESRTHGALTISDWMRPRLRYAVSAGVDSWSGARRALLTGASLEQRLFDDRLAVLVETARWWPFGSVVNHAFQHDSVRARWRTAGAPEIWGYDVSLGVSRVSDDAPLSLWGGAGEGRARPVLLRAHPLLEGGVIDLTPASTFGRTLRFASAEAQRWLPKPALVRVAIAGFVDVAQATRRIDGTTGPVQTDAGGGIRIRIPGAPGLLRLDIAHGLRNGANALTVGWTY